MSNHQQHAPVGQRVTEALAQDPRGEHGAGIGVSGGHSSANANNSQSGGVHTHSAHPIADKFLGHETQQANNESYGAFGTGRAPLSGGLTGAIDSDRTGYTGNEHSHSHSSGLTSGLTGSHDHHDHSHSHSHGQSAGVSSLTSGSHEHSHSHSHSHGTTGSGVNPNSALGASQGPLTAGPAGATQGLNLGAVIGGGGHSGHSHTGHAGHTHEIGSTGGKVVSGQHAGTAAGDDYKSGSTGGQAVSGQYAGTGTGDALTGQSHARTTGAGVGKLAENVSSNTTRDNAGTGVGPSGGAGGHYTTSGQSGHGVGAAGVGAGVGAGALAAGAGAHHSHDKSTTSHEVSGAGAGVGAGAAAAGAQSGSHSQGHGQTEGGSGAPITDPHELDSGGRHGLVYQESTGKYVHRRDLEGSNNRV